MPSISTHALHAESDDSATNFCIIAYISTHALHAESDFCRQNKFIWNTSFLPTLSMRRATNNMMLCYKAMTISTHALHAESDSFPDRSTSNTNNFYPRSPCGERLMQQYNIDLHKIFLPTLSMRRATAKDNKNTYKIYSQFVKTQNHCGLCPLILPHTAFK